MYKTVKKCTKTHRNAQKHTKNVRNRTDMYKNAKKCTK